jgi:GxxExxY protein
VPADPIPEHELCGLVIGCVHRVFNTLGPGLPEGPYAGALAIECEKHGLHAQREVPIAVAYDGIVVGTFRADLIINRTVLVELKACSISPEHHAQVLTYLRCSTIEVGLLISLDSKPVVKRFIIRNGVKAVIRSSSSRSRAGG